MRKLVKKILPAPLLRKLVEYNERRNLDNAVQQLFIDLQALKRSIKPINVGDRLNRLLIVAGDPITLFGSAGDDAMITATVQNARARNPDVEIDILVDGTNFGDSAHQRGFVTVDIFGKPDFIQALAQQFAVRKYDCIVVVGADVMDGYYHPLVSAKLLASADLAAAAGIKNVILGFSFNETPHPALAKFYSSLHPGVSLNVRDVVSLGRLEAFATAKAALVSDSAFSLVPSEPDEDTTSWIARKRAEGYRVMGFNLHPMLFKNADSAQIAAIIRRGAEALEFVADARPVCWLVIPHDYRKDVGDQACLKAITELTPSSQTDRVRYLDGRWPAPVLKGIAGKLDGLVSGRMHLAIAALGKGVPVICIAYQGKFEGLYQHFGLSAAELLSPSKFHTEDGIKNALINFVDQADEIREKVGKKLPEILDLSKRNFQVFETFAKQS
jgi:polysaccharide pyruvyl transferase WcaK-like protein